MKDEKELSRSIEKKMKEKFHLPHKVSSLIFEVFMLIYFYERKDWLARIPEVRKVVLENGFEEIAREQAEYAIRISDSDRMIEYEEMHKLLSLCEEIFALDYLGFKLENRMKRIYVQSVTKRLLKEAKKATMVIQDKLEDWNKDIWCYHIFDEKDGSSFHN